MKTRLIKTLVRNDRALGNDDYVLGRIMGAMAVLCKDDPALGAEYGRGCCEHGNIFVTKTTDERYAAFAYIVEHWYSGLCVFDYVE